MSSVVIAGNTSGSVTLAAPDVAGTTTLTLPATSATIATNVNGDLYPIVSGTSVATTSGTSKDFTGIPSWVKRITVMFSGVSGSGTSNFLVQIGSGSINSSGYSSASSRFLSASGAVATSTAGFLVTTTLVATDVTHGTCQIFNVSGNSWVATSVVGNVGLNGSQSGGGNVTLGGTLDRIRITTVNGTDTFDAGSINILYE